MAEFISPDGFFEHAPPDNLTLAQFMLDEQHPLRPVRDTANPWFIDDSSGRAMSFEEVRSRVYGLANGLSALCGIVDGDVVCTYTPNHIDYPVAMWAIHRLGATVSPANPAYTADELVYQLKLSNSKLIICHSSSLQTAIEAATQVGINSDEIVVLDVPQTPLPGKNGPRMTVDNLIQEGLKRQPSFVEQRLKSGEAKRKIAYLCFSSGTTGKPKAVAVAHYSVVANVLQFAASARIGDRSISYENQRVRPGDVSLAVLPFFHIYAIVVILHSTLFGGHSVVVVPKFSFTDVLDSINKYKVTHLWLVPPMVVLFCKHPAVKPKLLSSVRYCMVGAAPLSAELATQLIKVLPKAACVGQGYGMTETSTIVCMQPFSQQHGTPGSAGRLVTNTVARVVKPDGSLAKPGEEGELHVKGPQGEYNYYLNDPEANKETFVDGWVRTGDEVIIQENGDIFIVDRLKEILKVRGFQVAPAELEGHLLGLPVVADVGVVGVPCDYSGEVPGAFVALRADLVKRAGSDPKYAEVLRSQIYKHVSDSKVRYKWLDGGVHFVDSVPKNPSGKILRRVLRDMVKAQNLRGPGSTKRPAKL